MTIANSRKLSKNKNMKGKNGNLIRNLREGESAILDGPGKVIIKQIKKNKVIILINGENETNISFERESKEVGHDNKERAKE